MADDESLIDCISHYWEARCFEHSATTHGEVFLLYVYRREGAATLLLDLDIVYKGRGDTSPRFGLACCTRDLDFDTISC